MDNINLTDTVIMIIYEDSITLSKQDNNKYHHYKHYEELYKNDANFKSKMLGFNISDEALDGNKRADISMQLLASQGNIVFENGNTIEEEKTNNSILYLPENINAFQASVLKSLIPEFKKLYYLFVEQNTIDGRINWNAEYGTDKKGYQILEEIIDNYMKENMIVRKSK